MARRVLLFLMAALLARADGLDDAATQLARKITAHLAADEAAHVNWSNAAPTNSVPETDRTRVRTLLARGLQRRLRNPRLVEVTVTLSQNFRGYVIVAELQREGGNIVEMATAPRTAAVAPAELHIEKRLLWAQQEPILDAIFVVDQMLVFGVSGVTRYERSDANWRKVDAATFEIPPTRDPRGRITVTENSLTAEAAGVTCKGAWRPALALDCQAGGRFTAGRNTIEEAGWPPNFAYGEIGGEHVVVGMDGRTTVYDAARKQLGASDLFGDFAVLASPCAGAKLAASAPGTRAGADSIALYELVNHAPSRVSEAMEVPGSVTAMWPAGTTALAVVRNKNTDQYEAYSIGVDCGR